MINKVAEFIKKDDDFVIATHINPDGDGVGASLAFAYLLRSLGKKAAVAISEQELPPQYQFLMDLDKWPKAATFKEKVLVALDVANEKRLGEQMSALAECRAAVNIDHHPDNSDFADINWVDVSVTSTSEMVFELFSKMEIELTVQPATCIYVGMLTDTGRWQYSNTTSKSFKIAARLVELGVRPQEVFSKIYEQQSVEWLKMMAIGLGRAVFEKESGLAYTIINQKDLKMSGASMSETENVIDWLRSVKDIDVAMVIKEAANGEVKVSLRSQEPIDVGRIAREQGGGGHRNASGFISKDKPEVIVDKVEKWLTEFSS